MSGSLAAPQAEVDGHPASRPAWLGLASRLLVRHFREPLAGPPVARLASWGLGEAPVSPISEAQAPWVGADQALLRCPGRASSPILAVLLAGPLVLTARP